MGGTVISKWGVTGEDSGSGGVCVCEREVGLGGSIYNSVFGWGDGRRWRSRGSESKEEEEGG